MKGPADIAEVFGIFHDGIIAPSARDGAGEMVVEIEYLAERLSPAGDSFTVCFDDLERVAFTPWEEEGEPVLTTIVGFAGIMPLELQILSAKVVGDSVEVACSCEHRGAGCQGGSLEIIASGCHVHDESGREWSLEELGRLSDEYWDEWSARGGNDGDGSG